MLKWYLSHELKVTAILNHGLKVTAILNCVLKVTVILNHGLKVTAILNHWLKVTAILNHGLKVTAILNHGLKVTAILNHGLKVTAIHKYLKYESGRPFSWFPEEVSNARRDGDSNPALKKKLEDTKKLEGNSFYRKMIEELMRHIRTMFTTNEDLVDKAFRSPFFEDLEEINGACKIKEH